MAHVTTGQAIARSLVAQGVDAIFGIPGAHLYDFNDACYECRNDLDFIVTRHEQGAGYMAFGYAKSTGRVGVYAVVPGPGVLNSGAALCTAYGANAPVLCITGNVMSHLLGRGRGQLHELPDQLAILRGLTKWAQRIDHPTDVPRVLGEAFRQLRSGRVRPVAIEAPWDVFGMKAEVRLAASASADPPPDPDPDALAQAVELLKSAKNPMITLGAGALHAGEAVLQLAQLLQAPVTAHRSGKGILSDRSPYAMNMASGFEAWRSTDVLVGIGSRLELAHFRWRWFPPGLKTIRIDIDPEEMVRLPPDVAILADSAQGTAALVEALGAVIGKRASRVEEFQAIKGRAAAKIECVQPQMGYLKVIREVLPDDGFFVEEISQMGFTARFGFPVYGPRQYVTCGYQDNLGFGFNTALGVKVGNPGKAVVSISGDGGFLFGAQELATAVQHGINLVALVFDNGGFGNVRRDQIQVYGGRLIGSDLTNPDFVKLAESFGAIGYRADCPEALRPILERALQDEAPVVIEVRSERGGEASPWPFLRPAPPTRA